MIDPRELRIGNYVYFTDFPVKDRLVKLTIDEFKNGNDWFEYFITPIPLTEQHLIDFGFHVLRKGCYTIEIDMTKSFDLTEGKEGFYPSIAEDPEFSNMDFNVVGLNYIQYVHQLQNLYYALTGKELTKQ